MLVIGTNYKKVCWNQIDKLSLLDLKYINISYQEDEDLAQKWRFFIDEHVKVHDFSGFNFYILSTVLYEYITITVKLTHTLTLILTCGKKFSNKIGIQLWHYTFWQKLTLISLFIFLQLRSNVISASCDMNQAVI